MELDFQEEMNLVENHPITIWLIACFSFSGAFLESPHLIFFGGDLSHSEGPANIRMEHPSIKNFGTFVGLLIPW